MYDQDEKIYSIYIKMKIAIITLPLHFNYGGILQAYALKSILENSGHTVTMIEHKAIIPKLPPLRKRYLCYIKRFFIKIFHDKNDIVRYEDWFNRRIRGTQPFINKYIQSSDINISGCNFNEFDAVIVGSDQVWRPLYARLIEKYFLNFLSGNSRIIKIAYAASFGTDEWEYTPEQTENCTRLAKQFDLITVREDSGIKLCMDHFGINAEHVLDPTMLLDKEQYIEIVRQEKIPESNGNLFAYILDDSKEKQDLIYRIADISGSSPFSIIPADAQLFNGTPYPNVPVWLRAFIDAEFVITDSFHGCVFSIIFNKPFIALGNHGRGQSRFDSLLRLFNLQSRLINLNEFTPEILSAAIDWDVVNTRLTSVPLRGC